MKFASLSIVLFALISVSAVPREGLRQRGAPPPRSTPEGLALLHTVQDALGGANRIAAIRDYDEIIRAEAWDAPGMSLGEVRKRTRWMQIPSVLRLDQRGPRGTYVLYLDGGSRTGWELLPDLTSADPFKTTGRRDTLAGGELAFAIAYLEGFELNDWLADRRGYTVTSPRPNVLRIEHEGHANDLTIDPTTRLPVSSAGVSLADPEHPVSAELRFVGWQNVSGVRFATHRINLHSGVKRGEVTTESIRINSGLSQSELARIPTDFLPEIVRR